MTLFAVSFMVSVLRRGVVSAAPHREYPSVYYILSDEN